MAVEWTKVAFEDDVVTKATFNAKGDLLSATADDTPSILSVGTNNYVLTADSGESTGLKWAASQAASTLDSIGDVASITEEQGDILYWTGAAWDALSHGTSGQFLKTQGDGANPIWADASVATLDAIGDVTAITEARGQIIYRAAAAWDALDACKRFSLPEVEAIELPGCRCGEVLSGMLQPDECALFGKACTPRTPYGPCMVSSEGSCAARYRYG